jgi:ubiquinone/menaquinone biosynthesis C-methylase UbiE
MPTAGHGGHLGAVYGSKRPEDTAAIYDRWAETYEAEMSAAGYRHPSICLSLVTRHMPIGASPLLDAGAGTGLIGEWLGILGYPHVEALDVSKGMLEVAKRKRVYAALHNLALGTALPFTDGHFAGIVSAGVFTSGHVGVEGLDELIRICRSGGAIVLTIKCTLWDGGFSARVGDLVQSGQLKLIEVTEPYVSMPGETGTIPSRAVVLRRL